MAAVIGETVVNVEVQDSALRLRALELAIEVRVEDETPESIVSTAQAFADFLEGK